MKLFNKIRGAPPIRWVQLPTKKGLTEHPFIFPHELFSSLYHERPSSFRKHLVGPDGAARQYWENIADTEFVRRHPGLGDRDYTAPIGMHGDAGAFNHQDPLLMLSWNGLLARGKTRTKRFLFTALRKHDYLPQTLDASF